MTITMAYLEELEAVYELLTNCGQVIVRRLSLVLCADGTPWHHGSCSPDVIKLKEPHRRRCRASVPFPAIASDLIDLHSSSSSSPLRSFDIQAEQ